jgi:hypothetical protein
LGFFFGARVTISGANLTPPPTFLGVDAETLSKALTLIRDKFRLATDATIFLELKTRESGINAGIANQRDATSHLASLLRMDGLDRRTAEAQLNHIEEHLRRAVMEPYERTVQLLQQRLLDQLPLYNERVLSLPGVSESLPDAPTLKQIDACLDAIDRMCTEGRRAKQENSWSDAWDRGVKHFIAAVAELEVLSRDVKDALVKAEQVRREQELKAMATAHADEERSQAERNLEEMRRLTDTQIEEVRASARRAKRRTYLLLPVSAALGLLLKVLWDWYIGAGAPPVP